MSGTSYPSLDLKLRAEGVLGDTTNPVSPVEIPRNDEEDRLSLQSDLGHKKVCKEISATIYTFKITISSVPRRPPRLYSSPDTTDGGSPGVEKWDVGTVCASSSTLITDFWVT